MDNPGYRIFSPRIHIDDWRAAYGLECIRIWKEAQQEIAATGNDPAPYYPSEEEFRAARSMFSSRTIFNHQRGGR